MKISIFEFKTPLLIHRIWYIRLILVLVFYSNLFVFDKNFWIPISWMYDLRYTIFIPHHITITEYWDFQVLFEIVYSLEVCTSCKCLSIGPPMYRDKVCSSTLESLTELYEE